MDDALKTAIKTAIKAESLGVAFYADLAKKYADDPELNEMFKLLARDEVEHKKQFEEILSAAEGSNITPNEIDIEFLNGIDISSYFAGMEKVDTTLTPSQILQSAFNFEKESVLYYTTIRDIIGKNPQLDEIIKIEKLHMNQLMKVLASGSKFRGMADTWL